MLMRFFARSMYRVLLCGVVLMLPFATYAHGSLSARIDIKTVEISKDSTNATLFFERGFLYQQHEDFNEAINDYIKSEKLGNKEDVLQYRKAEVYFALKNFELALTSTNNYANKSDVKIRKIKAQILLNLNRYAEALIDYKFVVDHMVDIRPSDIIEYSSIYLLIDSTDYSGAINAIDIGLNKLGPKVITLRSKKIAYLKRSNQQEKVIEQYDALIKENTRKEFWYYKKAVFLFDINKMKDCKFAMQQANSAIEELNSRYKNTPAIKELQVQLKTLENQLHHEN